MFDFREIFGEIDEKEATKVELDWFNDISNWNGYRNYLASNNIELTPKDMMAISNLNRNRRFNDPGDFCEGAFNSFYPIYD